MQFTPNQKKAHDLNRHISVTAGAGSGKTAVLASRYLKILLDKNIRPSQAVAITFTDKAAAELKHRIIREVDERLAERNRDPILEAIKEEMTMAPISTIHSFCTRILREYSVEAGVDAGFGVISGIKQQLLLQEAVSTTLKSIAAEPEDSSTRQKLADLLRIFGKKKLEAILHQLVAHRDTLERLTRNVYNRSDQEVLDYWYEFLQGELAGGLERFPIENWMRCLNAALSIAKGKNAPRVAELTAEIEANASDSGKLTEICSEIGPLITIQKGTIAKTDFLGRGVKEDTIKTEIDFLVDAVKHFRSIPPLTDDDKLLIRVTRPLLELYQQIEHNYEIRKAEQGQLDFEDLLIQARNLLEQGAIRERLAERYRYIMVDEYQDTNRLQYEILKPLVSNFQSGNLFIVGDSKQSIYGFRGADVRVFNETLKEIKEDQAERTDDFVWDEETLEADASEQQGDLHLPENFRLLRNLIGFVNLVFDSTMSTGDAKEFEVAYESLIQGRDNDAPGDVELIIPYLEADSEAVIGDSDDITSDSEADLIAARIRSLVGTEAEIWERDDAGEKSRPARYSDIAILLRSRTHLIEVESALRKANIPYHTTGGIGFYQRQEIYDIYNYLQFLVNPEDDTALVGILRAPFFGISDPELYEISQHLPRERRERTDGEHQLMAPTEDKSSPSFWDSVQAYAGQAQHNTKASEDAEAKSPLEQHPPIQHVVQILKAHLEICHRMPISVLIRQIVNDTGMIGVLPIGTEGEQRWANYEKLLDIAREFEEDGFTTLPDFLEYLNLLITEEDSEGQATVDLKNDAVQIMTVHAAKGLEFPVVILPQMNRKFQYNWEPFIDDRLGLGFCPDDPDNNYEQSDPTITQLMKNRSCDKTHAEHKRLFYVAATRARDRLIITATLKKEKPTGWFSWLCDALDLPDIPSDPTITRPVTIEKLEREQTTKIAFELPIRIIRTLDELDFVEEEAATADTPVFPKYHITPLEPALVGETFSVTQLVTYIHCPTKYHLKYQLYLPDIVEQEAVLPQPAHPETDGTALGRAVHEVLAKLRTKADYERVDALIESAVRRPGGTVSAQMVREHVYRFLESELGQTALDAPMSYCEQHLYALIGEHTVNGITDRLVKGHDGLWQVIDYKTEAIDQSEIEARANHHRSQLELYALLVYRLYPEQSTVPVTIFFSHLAEAYPMPYRVETLKAIEAEWIARIERIQGGMFEKNTEHCPRCPYFVNEECLASGRNFTT